ncbi:MAG: TRL-like family protein [Candidatus Poribacteria bacterium]
MSSPIGLFLSCATGTRTPIIGFGFSDLYYGMAISSNQAGNRVGEACSKSFAGIIAVGDSSIETARRNGGITMISSVDEHINSFLGVFAKYCIIVRGR